MCLESSEISVNVVARSEQYPLQVEHSPLVGNVIQAFRYVRWLLTGCIRLVTLSSSMMVNYSTEMEDFLAAGDASRDDCSTF
jgi:hypothetical protein